MLADSWALCLLTQMHDAGLEADVLADSEDAVTADSQKALTC